MPGASLEFGLVLPQWSELLEPTEWPAIAAHAESCGFDAVAKGDHIVFLDDDQG